jgi:hypothetical protein
MSKKKDKKYGKRSQATVNLMKNIRKQMGEVFPELSSSRGISHFHLRRESR